MRTDRIVKITIIVTLLLIAASYAASASEGESELTATPTSERVDFNVVTLPGLPTQIQILQVLNGQGFSGYDLKGVLPGGAFASAFLILSRPTAGSGSPPIPTRKIDFNVVLVPALPTAYVVNQSLRGPGSQGYDLKGVLPTPNGTFLIFSKVI